MLLDARVRAREPTTTTTAMKKLERKNLKKDRRSEKPRRLKKIV